MASKYANDHSWDEGVSGNPGGRSKLDREWKAWCQQFAKENREHIKTRALHNDRFMSFILEQAHGKATEHKDVTSNGETIRSLDDLRAVVAEVEQLQKQTEGKESILQ